MSVYIEHDDHHNSPMIERYDSADEAVARIARAENDDVEEVHTQLFDEEDGFGEYTGCDRWRLITAEIADQEAEEWRRVAGRIREDKPIYGGDR